MALLAQDLREAVLQAAFEGKLSERKTSDTNVDLQFKGIIAEKEELLSKNYQRKATNNSMNIMIPDEWLLCELKDVVYNRGQKTPTKEFSYIDIGSIDNIKHRLNETETLLSPDKAPSRARKIVKTGDVIYSTVRPYLHNVCVVDKEFNGEPICSTGFAVMTCHTGLLNKYLFYYLLSPAFDKYANDNENAKGVAYPAINDKKLYSAIFPLAPIEEQQRIVERVEELMSKIDEFEIIENKLEALKKSFPEDMKASLLQAAMQGKLTEQLTTDTSVEVVEEIPKEEIPFDIPKSWKWTYLNNIATINGGFAFKSSKYSQNGARVIRISDFNEDGFNDSNIVRYDYTDDLEQYIIENKNILLCMTGGTVGKSLFVNNVPEKMLSNQRVATIKIDGALPEYVYKVILSPFIQQMIDDSKNSTNDNISMTLIKNFPIPVPPIEEQERIVKHLEKLMNNFN